MTDESAANRRSVSGSPDVNHIFTIGHSTRSIEEFIEALRRHDVAQLVDIRSIPGSRHVPQFAKSAMETTLPKAGIEYVHLKELGGRRNKSANSVNGAWHNASFRNYADYMQTKEFSDGIDHLLKLAKKTPSAIMCAEAVPWRCHRRLVADALTVRGVNVSDIMNETTAKPHVMTPFAVVNGTQVTYPADAAADRENTKEK